MILSLANSDIKKLALDTALALSRGEPREGDLQKILCYLNQEQKADFHLACSELYAESLQRQAGSIDHDNKTFEPSMATRSATAPVSPAAFIAATERLWELSACFDEHQIRGSIHFNTKFLDNLK